MRRTCAILRTAGRGNLPPASHVGSRHGAGGQAEGRLGGGCAGRPPGVLARRSPGTPAVARFLATIRPRRGSSRAVLMTQTTYSAKPGEVARDWYLVDAEGKTLGRLAT